MGLISKIFRRLPLFKGKERLAKMIFKKEIDKKKNFWIKGKFGCAYFVPNIIENISFELFFNGIYEQGTSDFIISNLPANGVFLDLGANIGAIAVPILKKRQDIQIFCIEAAPWIYQFLEQNIRKNGTESTVVLNKALFYTDNEILNFYSPDEKFGKGSLSPVFTDKVIPVVTMKVDTLITEFGLKKVDIIKIDVEGYEYHVFKGATELLSRADAPDIIFEFVDWAEEAAKGVQIGDSQRILNELGYRLFYFDEKGPMKEVREVLTKGFFMLFATKRNNH